MVLIAWSCGEQVTGVEQPTAAVSQQLRPAAAKVAQSPGRYACFLNIYDREAGNYRYYHLPLSFPQGMTRVSGTTRYRYRGYERGTEYAFLANCYIPDSPKAAVWLSRQLRGGPLPQQATGGAPEGEVSLLSCIEGTVCLDPLTVYACQWRGTWPNCKPPLASDIPPCYDGGGCGGGDPIPTGGSGPVCEDCFPEDEEPPCKTGDTVVDNLAVQKGFDDLWKASNPDATDPAQRRERGGWIVRETTGALAVVPFTDVTSDVCSISPNDNWSPVPPANAVAWVHTHPFAYKEVAWTCGVRDPVTGLRIFPEYLGLVSPHDALIGDRINQRLQALGKPAIVGYMIDKNGIKRFLSFATSPTAGAPMVTGAHARCGY